MLIKINKIKLSLTRIFIKHFSLQFRKENMKNSTFIPGSINLIENCNFLGKFFHLDSDASRISVFGLNNLPVGSGTGHKQNLN